MAPFVYALLPQSSPTYSPPPINPIAIGMALGSAIRTSQERNVRQIASALSTIQFEPLTVLTELVTRELISKQIPFTQSADIRLDEAVHNENYKNLPREPEIILDVQMHDAGYYPNTKPDRYSPYISVVARILSTATKSIFEEFSYEAGEENVANSRRYYSIPNTASFPSLEKLREESSLIKIQMTSALSRIAEAIAEDVARVIAKQTRID